MDYIKTFDNHEEYEEFVAGGEMPLDNISHCIEKNHVHYNPEQEDVVLLTLTMTGGNTLVFDAGTKGDGTSMNGFVLGTGQSVQIIKGLITAHLQIQDTTSKRWNFYDTLGTGYQYTTGSGETYYHSERMPYDSETITFEPLADVTFVADVD